MGRAIRAWHWLARTDVAAVLITAAILLLAVGSLFPQLPPPEVSQGERLARWEALAADRYGRLTGILSAVGAFRFFRSPPFLLMVALLTLATLACTANRWPGIWREAFRRPMAETWLDTAPFTATLTPPTPDTTASRTHADALQRVPGIASSPANAAAWASALASRSLRERGYRVRSERTGETTHLRGERNRLSRLASLVAHLAVLLLLAGALVTALLGWREELTVTPGGTAAVGHGSDLLVRNEGFAIPRYTDGTPANYEARVEVVAGGRAIRRTVAVNQPLAIRGVHLYLSGFQPTEAGYAVTFLAVHDPGYGIVIAAGLLLLLGMTIVFAFPHSAVHAQIAADGTVHLAGWAGRWDFGFPRGFRELVAELERQMARGQDSPVEQPCSR